MPAPPKDIVERIRGLRYVHVPVASELMNEAATAIETLRWQLEIRENIIGRLVAETQRLRLTDAERNALREMCDFADALLRKEDPTISTLRSLLSRL